MLAASVIGILVWTAAGAAVIASLKTGGLATLPPPAVGWIAFLMLTIALFRDELSAVGGAVPDHRRQASTVREVQTLSMPVTFGQVVIFGFAATAVSAPDLPMGLAAAIFPLSSPLVMVARAAQQPDPDAAPGRDRMAAAVGCRDPQDRRADVPQDRAQVGAVEKPQMVALQPRLADRRFRHRRSLFRASPSAPGAGRDRG